MLRMMGAVDEKTLVVTSVHDCQVLPEENDIDTTQLLLHDVPVDVICTPTRARTAAATAMLPPPPKLLSSQRRRRFCVSM